MMHRRKRLRLESESQPALENDSQETVEFEKEPSPQAERLEAIQYTSDSVPEPPVSSMLKLQNVESPVAALPQIEQFESPVKTLQNQQHFELPIKSLHEHPQFESPTQSITSVHPYYPEESQKSPDSVFEAAERSSFLPDIERDEATPAGYKSPDSPPDSPVLPLEDGVKNESCTKTVSHPRAELIEDGDIRYVKLFNSDGTSKTYRLQHL